MDDAVYSERMLKRLQINAALDHRSTWSGDKPWRECKYCRKQLQGGRLPVCNLCAEEFRARQTRGQE